METNLENLSALVAEHRQSKKRGRYPTTVWESIARLRKDHAVPEIARTSGINASEIYRRTSAKRGSLFREVRITPPLSASKPVVMELRRADGAELRFRCDASREELSEIFTSFLRL